MILVTDEFASADVSEVAKAPGSDRGGEADDVGFKISKFQKNAAAKINSPAPIMYSEIFLRIFST